MKVRNRHILSLILVLIGLTCSMRSLAQGVPPSVQAKIDSMQAWIAQEAEAGRPIEQEALEAWNRRIRAEQDRVNALSEADRKQAEQSVGSSAELKQFSGMTGTAFTVPAGKAWKLRRVTCSAGMGDYQILVKSIAFPEELSEGEVLQTPSFSSEAALVAEDQSEIMYTFEVLQFDLK